MSTGLFGVVYDAHAVSRARSSSAASSSRRPGVEQPLERLVLGAKLGVGGVQGGGDLVREGLRVGALDAAVLPPHCVGRREGLRMRAGDRERCCVCRGGLFEFPGRRQKNRSEVERTSYSATSAFRSASVAGAAPLTAF